MIQMCSAPAGEGLGVGFGTKAETLLRLQPLVRSAVVPDNLVFDVGRWRAAEAEVLAGITARFRGRPLAVRSSAVGEDGAVCSMAGSYVSRLGVDGGDPRAVEQAVRAVIGSYTGDLRDQVLVQPMVGGVAMSGVVMTRDLNDGAPSSRLPSGEP